MKIKILSERRGGGGGGGGCCWGGGIRMMLQKGNSLRCSLKLRKRTWFVFRKQNGNLVLKG